MKIWKLGNRLNFMPLCFWTACQRICPTVKAAPASFARRCYDGYVDAPASKSTPDILYQNLCDMIFFDGFPADCKFHSSWCQALTPIYTLPDYLESFSFTTRECYRKRWNALWSVLSTSTPVAAMQLPAAIHDALTMLKYWYLLQSLCLLKFEVDELHFPK